MTKQKKEKKKKLGSWVNQSPLPFFFFLKGQEPITSCDSCERKDQIEHVYKVWR